jgi:phosphoglycerate dehydrogenase-like enzyme
MRILVLHSEPDELRDWLSQRTAGHQLFWAATPEQVQETLPQADPEVVFSIKHSGFPGPAHRQALEWPSVRWLHVGGSGTDHLGRWDLARQTVTNSVGVLAPFHAERALAGLLALSSGLLRQTQAQAQRSWEPSRFATLRGQTALIVGVGRTGTALASLLKALGMRVLGVRRRHERHPDVDEMHEFSQLAQLWPRAQVVSLNVPGGEPTHHLMGREAFSALPRGALLLNGSRGSVVDQEAMIGALESGRLGGAWLDVFEQEPLPAESPLWGIPNVVVSAHCADQVEDFPLRFAQLFLDNLERFAQGRPLANVVSSPA